MHLIISVLVILFSVVATAQKEENRNLHFNQSLIEEVEQFRKMKHESAIDTGTSPLTAKDLKKFKGFNYYEFNGGYRIAGPFRRTPKEKIFKMPTSGTKTPEYRKYGVFTFELFNQKHELSVYQNIKLLTKEGYDDYLFIPFKDHTNGIDTYGGGRYINVTIPQNDSLIINFNLAYNPYCAYNDRYSCPIPPEENHLDVKITAGEKKFKDDSH